MKLCFCLCQRKKAHIRKLQVFIEFCRIVLFDCLLHIQDFYFYGFCSKLDLDHIACLDCRRCFCRSSVDQTLPASQASFATVRLLISLETFKNLSSLIVISPFADKKKLPQKCSATADDSKYRN